MIARPRLTTVLAAALLSAGLAAFAPFSQLAAEPTYDLVITNGRVVDGTGNPWFRADVAIKDGRIARVGRVSPGEARAILDARNQVVAPGFIDVHAHVEGIYRQPEAENFTRMGVTTLVSGNCGSSANDVGEFLGRIRETPLAVNLATLVGHGTVRQQVLKLENRAPTAEEQRRMEEIVERAMADGAVGLSTGLIYVPGTYAKTEEVVGLARAAARHGGLYATHMRNEGEHVREAIRESIEIGERAGLPVEISHFKISSKRLWGKSPETIQMVRDARERGLQVTVDQYAYAASSTSLDSQLPSWALEGGREEGKKRLSDAETRKRIVAGMKDALKSRGVKDYSFAIVASHQANPAFNGKSIAAITKEVRSKSDVDSQIDQILDMYAAGGAQMVYHSMDERDVQLIMREPFTMIASDAGVRRAGEGVPHPRGTGNNARVLGRYVRELKVVSLEDAIRKMTSLPAQTFRLADRGLLREGFAADIVVFDPATVADRATFEQPHQYPVGIGHVLVNGVAVIAEGQATGARPGAALRGPGAARAQHAPAP
ncbi:MAG TPA: D-aminoacylase [Pyrinomonadaceae bacterium]|nr:D-aminoacylase [Pyrinomonadaceae bacterium]